MADKKISQLTALTGANTASDDLLVIVDTSTTTTKNISLTEIQSAPVFAGTANGVVYLNGSKVQTTGSAFSYDGSTLLNSGTGGTQTLRVWANTTSSPIAQLDLQRGTNATWGADAYGDYRFKNSAGDLLIQYGESSTTTDRITLSSTGNVTIGQGNLVIGTSGKGIDFSATAGTGTSELLDDYEEGTWTPTVTGDGGTNGTLAFTSSGTYTKTGRVVTLNGTVSLTNLGSLTGRIGIGGVPFACDVETYFGSFGAANINPTGAATISSWSGAISTNKVHFAITLAAAGGMDSLRFTQLTTSTSLWFTISYITTA